MTVKELKEFLNKQPKEFDDYSLFFRMNFTFNANKGAWRMDGYGITCTEADTGNKLLVFDVQKEQ